MNPALLVRQAAPCVVHSVVRHTLQCWCHAGLTGATTGFLLPRALPFFLCVLQHESELHGRTVRVNLARAMKVKEGHSRAGKLAHTINTCTHAHTHRENVCCISGLVLSLFLGGFCFGVLATYKYLQ